MDSPTNFALLSSNKIANVLYYAKIFNLKKTNLIMTPLDVNDLIKTIDSLFDELNKKNISYLLVGGIAMLTLVEGRNTEDVDLIMSYSDLSSLDKVIINHENKNFVRANYQGLQIDLLLTQNPLFEQVKQNYNNEIEWRKFRISCATPEGLIILKFYALPSLYRQGNFDRAALYETDILQLLYHYNVNLEQQIQIVDPHLLASDRLAIREIAQDIEKRCRRMQGKQSSHQQDQLEP
ncbi:hypothetical protein L3556_04950 [Candidatus Synechococcus calcipolaris G9]|uniref:Nucleotidyl transferase AbiEii/AbiGii toxin family protein n=1 Tax=Candidatus Synechococcus calcipolaris G9 TaxID=1497997 RepID=A0ABT6EWX9_9SYNE|nr:hypothetical protein [Candidatus Synechococcus calcipolaris]MDG2990286.1 hypothetical protein [Candidatus Synechococcus calcipolaris G9]